MKEPWSSRTGGMWSAGAAQAPERVLAAFTDALFARNPDLVWEVGLEGRVRRVNPRIMPVLGYAAEDVVGRPLAELVVPEDAAEVDAALRQVAGGESGTSVLRARHRAGQVVVLRANVLPFVIDGRVATVYLGCRDVTASHAARQALAEREAMYSMLVEHSPECVAVFQDGLCAYINPAGAAMASPTLTPAELIGQHWEPFYHPDDRARMAAVYQELLEAPVGTARHVEKRLVWPDGHVIECEGTAAHVQFRGRPAIYNIIRDVTARRRAETERLRGQRFEALGRLAAGVAHDFNNLLAVMLTSVEQVAEAIPDHAELKADLDAAAGAARRGRGLTRQLLTFARHEPAEPRRLDVNAVVRGMQELLRRIAGPRVRLELALAPDAGAVLADASQAEQVLMNLVTNARDAMPEGGEIRVETARENGDLRLTVRDTGPGIPPEVRPHLFEPFFSTKAEGSGLGLATVYGVVTAAGGRIDVESEPGCGAAFHMRLPRTG